MARTESKHDARNRALIGARLADYGITAAPTRTPEEVEQSRKYRNVRNGLERQYQIALADMHETEAKIATLNVQLARITLRRLEAERDDQHMSYDENRSTLATAAGYEREIAAEEKLLKAQREIVEDAHERIDGRYYSR